MPFRLIGTIILLLVVTIFAGANLDNRCDINFIFTKVQQVPVFLTAIVSFLIGAIIMIPFTFKKKCNKDKKSQNSAETKSQKSSDEESKTLFDFKIKRDVSKNQGKDKKKKKSWFGKSNGKSKESDKTETSQKSENEEKSSSSQNSETEKTQGTI